MGIEARPLPAGGVDVRGRLAQVRESAITRVILVSIELRHETAVAQPPDARGVVLGCRHDVLPVGRDARGEHAVRMGGALSARALAPPIDQYVSGVLISAGAHTFDCDPRMYRAFTCE